MKTLLPLCIFIMVLSSCGDHPSDTTKVSSSDSTSSNLQSKIVAENIDTVKVIEDPQYIPNGDSTYPYRILNTQIYHSDEVPDDSEDQKWFGLFKSKSGYYISTAAVRIKTVWDPIADEDSTNLTGKLVTTNNRDTNILLISGADMPVHTVTSVAIPHSTLHPEDGPFSFTYKGVAYKLYATGIKKNDTIDKGYYYYYNYKLYLQSTKDGKEVSQLIRAIPRLGYDELLFIGDIDGDDIPDMIFDFAGYNLSMPTLYLSHQAKPNEILRVVATQISVGC